MWSAAQYSPAKSGLYFARIEYTHRGEALGATLLLSQQR